MKDTPLVSICLPVYNKPTYLDETLYSLSNQTYNNLEIIISDDHSSDSKVMKVVQNHKQKDDRISIYEQQTNIGAVNNYLFILNKVHGKYVLLASDDDFWDPNYIMEGVDLLENNSNYDVWGSSLYQIDSYDRILRTFPTFDRFTSVGTPVKNIIKYSLEPEVYGKCHIFHSLYRTIILKRLVNQYFITEDKPWQDYIFSILVLFKARFYGSKDYLFYKRWIRESDKNENFTPLIISNPWKSMMLIGISQQYIYEHYKVLKGSNCRFFVVIILLFRLMMTYLYILKDNLSLFFRMSSKNK